ncbi:phosphatidylinositol 3-kinase [Pelomyxa schiedti]|nr:phosphatidylinositol 3-kinase [Pelomyxa schiedti]
MGLVAVGSSILAQLSLREALSVDAVRELTVEHTATSIMPTFWGVVVLLLIFFPPSVSIKVLAAGQHIFTGLVMLFVRTASKSLWLVFIEGWLFHWWVAVYLICDLWFKKLEFGDSRTKPFLQKFVSTFLMVSGLLGFPILNYFTSGFSWPNYVLLGAECPTTLFTVGLLVSSLPNSSRVVLWLLAVNGMAIGAFSLVRGFFPDVLYFLAGVLGIAMTFLYGHPYYIHPPSPTKPNPTSTTRTTNDLPRAFLRPHLRAKSYIFSVSTRTTLRAADKCFMPSNKVKQKLGASTFHTVDARLECSKHECAEMIRASEALIVSFSRQQAILPPLSATGSAKPLPGGSTGEHTALPNVMTSSVDSALTAESSPPRRPPPQPPASSQAKRSTPPSLPHTPPPPPPTRTPPPPPRTSASASASASPTSSPSLSPSLSPTSTNSEPVSDPQTTSTSAPTSKIVSTVSSIGAKALHTNNSTGPPQSDIENIFLEPLLMLRNDIIKVAGESNELITNLNAQINALQLEIQKYVIESTPFFHLLQNFLLRLNSIKAKFKDCDDAIVDMDRYHEALNALMIGSSPFDIERQNQASIKYETQKAKTEELSASVVNETEVAAKFFTTQLQDELRQFLALQEQFFAKMTCIYTDRTHFSSTPRPPIVPRPVIASDKFLRDTPNTWDAIPTISVSLPVKTNSFEPQLPPLFHFPLEDHEYRFFQKSIINGITSNSSVLSRNDSGVTMATQTQYSGNKHKRFESFTIHCYFVQMNSPPIQIKCPGSTKICDLITQAVSECNSLNSTSIAPESCVVKIHGSREQILHTNLELSSVEYVRHRVSRRKPVNLSIDQYHIDDRTIFPIPTAPSNYQVEFADCVCLPSSKVELEFKVKLLSIEGLLFSMLCPELIEKDLMYDVLKQSFEKTKSLEDSEVFLYVSVKLIYGKHKINNMPMVTQNKPTTTWNELLHSKILFNQLPRESRLLFNLYGQRGLSGRKVKPLAGVCFSLFDYDGVFKGGTHRLHMWNTTVKPLSTTSENLNPKCIVINFELESPPIPLFHCLPDVPLELPPPDEVENPPEEDNLAIASLSKKDALFTPTPTELGLLWSHRYWLLLYRPDILPKLLLCALFLDITSATQLFKILEHWPLIDPSEALILFDAASYPAAKIRDYAVKCIAKFTDQQLLIYLLQLVQAIKTETYHHSTLVEFLLLRAIQNPSIIGHSLFWNLQAEVNRPEYRVRLGMVTEAYFWSCGPLAINIVYQCNLMKSLSNTAKSVACVHQGAITQASAQPSGAVSASSSIPSAGVTPIGGPAVVNSPAQVAPKERIKAALCAGLSTLFDDANSSTAPLCLPINPTVLVRSTITGKCKIMDSFTAPLWLVFENSVPLAENLVVIFKTGDDLRQDILSLQIFEIMDRIWQEHGLDLRMSVYKVVATDVNSGMIQVVPDSSTVASIQKDAAGVGGALLKTSLLNWIEKNNPNKEEYDEAIENFTLSCAAYCVATYVTGIGDRHNDNIMIDKTGHLFHIDFSQFLGNVMKFGPVDRERAPFVFTSEFAHVMGGTDTQMFELFTETCCNAFNIIRRYANLFISLFKLMIGTGIPQLHSEKDIVYLHNAFALDKTDEEASAFFKELIAESLNTKRTQVNFLFHNLAHMKT